MKVKNIISLSLLLCHIGFSQEPPDFLIKPSHLGASLPNNRNINHQKGTKYQDLKRGTVLLFSTDNNTTRVPGICTGTLMNTVNNSMDGDYFILTANHCFSEYNRYNFLYISFDYEVPYANKRGDPNRDREIAKYSLLPASAYEIVVQDTHSDIVLLKVKSNELDELQKKIFNNAYATGYTLNPSYPRENFINISHPHGDHKKIFINPSGVNNSFRSFIPVDPREAYKIGHQKYVIFPGSKIKLFPANWDNVKGSSLQEGSSGSSLIDIKDDKFGVAAVTSTGDSKSNEFAFSYLENAWRISPSISNSLQDFLDPENTWISKIPGGYLNEAIPNDQVDYDLDFSEKATFKIDFSLSIANFFVHQIIGETKEKFLGNGLLSTHISEPIYLTITPKDDPNYILYGTYLRDGDHLPLTFNGNSWSKSSIPPFSNLPSGESVKYLALNYFPYDSDKMQRNIANYYILKMKEAGVDPTIKTIQGILQNNDIKMETIITLGTGNGNKSPGTKVRAIKFPHFMPYNAVELFEPSRFDNLWKFKSYPKSRGKSSDKLFINQVSTNVSSKPISSGNNGGYLNLVNELIPLGKVAADPQDDESTFEFNAKVKKKSSINKFYYKIWIDLNRKVDSENQYNFGGDDKNTYPELLAEGESEDDEFAVTCTVPNPSDLGINAGEERFYRVRFAVSDEDNVTQDGFYLNGEVEDYLLSMSVPPRANRQFNTADGAPKGDQNELINSAEVAAEATIAEDEDTTSKELVAVAVLPNPASEAINVSFDSRTGGAATIALYTLSGSQILSEEIQSSVGSNSHKLNTTTMTQGTYIIKVKGAGVDSSTLLAIERE